MIEGAWITPAAAARSIRRLEGVRAVFIHEPDPAEVSAAMMGRSGTDIPTPRGKVTSKVFWLFGNWVREQALAEGLQSVNAPPRETLIERVLTSVQLGVV